MINIGCSGFYYPDWRGNFYPKTMDQGEYLRYYSLHFNSVEINTTFYNYPKSTMIQSWIKQFKGMGYFKFSFKFPKIVTHNPAGFTDDSILTARNFMNDVLLAFDENDLLGAGLLQFSPYFNPLRNKNWPSDLHHLLQNLDTRKYRIAIELRNKRFLQKDNLVTLKNIIADYGVSIVSVDSPGFPLIIIEDSPFLYIRFHGRNSDIWFGKNPTDGRLNKYDYLYSKEELKEIRQKIGQMKDDTFIYFNNHAQSKAAINALQFSEMLGVRINRFDSQKSLIDF